MNDPRDPNSLYEELDSARTIKAPLRDHLSGFRLVYTCPSCRREWAYLPAARFFIHFPIIGKPVKGKVLCSHIECGGAFLNLQDYEAEKMARELSRGDIPPNVKPHHRAVFLTVLDHGPITRDDIHARLSRSQKTRVASCTVFRHLSALLEQGVLLRKRVRYHFYYEVVTHH